MNVFVFLSFLGLELQGELSALPPLGSREPLARHDRPLRDEDVLSPLFRGDFLNDGEKLVGEWGSRQISFGDILVSVTLRLLIVRNVAKSSVQPVVALRLGESTPSETKPEVVRLDDLSRLFRPNQVK
jgi:hypothetical protein